MKTKILFLGLILSVLTIGCSKDDKNESSTTFTSDEARVNAKMDVANDDVSDIVEGQFNATQSNASGRATEINAAVNLPACATVTRVPDFETPLTSGTEVTKTIDFGTTGCTMANGNVLKGKIIITFTYQPEATSHTINYQFDNFYHNAIKFLGNRTFTRTMSVGTVQNPSHPIVVMNLQMTATFPDGRVFTRVGTRTREIISGYNTPLVFIDNIYQVTGNWTTTFPNTTVQTSTITTPLLVKMSCINQNKPLLVQGIITFTRNGNTATLDYGDGTCDNLAVFTINGNAYNIIIGN
jgi:hypothetical protein